METVKNDYTIDRKSASRLLKVSMRTVDRYIRQNKLSSRSFEGRVWLSKAELRVLKDMKRPKVEVVNVDMSRHKMSIDNSVDNEVDTVESVSTSSGSRVYKKLYEETLEENHKRQEQLSRATYHIGRLEAQVRYSVPLLQYHKEKKQLKAANRKLDVELDKALVIIKEIKEEHKIERFNKHIYLLILMSILILQPIFWFMFR